jgi:hypothetical protein
VSFAAITVCDASQRVFVVVYFVIDSVRKLLDTPSYVDLLQEYIYIPKSLYRDFHFYRALNFTCR